MKEWDKKLNERTSLCALMILFWHLEWPDQQMSVERRCECGQKEKDAMKDGGHDIFPFIILLPSNIARLAFIASASLGLAWQDSGGVPNVRQQIESWISHHGAWVCVSSNLKALFQSEVASRAREQPRNVPTLGFYPWTVSQRVENNPNRMRRWWGVLSAVVDRWFMYAQGGWRCNLRQTLPAFFVLAGWHPLRCREGKRTGSPNKNPGHWEARFRWARLAYGWVRRPHSRGNEWWIVHTPRMRSAKPSDGETQAVFLFFPLIFFLAFPLFFSFLSISAARTSERASLHLLSTYCFALGDVNLCLTKA